MLIFLTGASGWVGAAVTADLVAAGHHVLGLVRTAEKADSLRAAGAEPVLGSLDDLDILRAASDRADAVIHTAFNHDFSRFAENAAQDRRAIMAMGETLIDSERTLIVTSGLAMLAQGRPATEADTPLDSFPRQSEAAARDLAAREVHVATVRLASCVHGAGEHGFVAMLAGIARQSGVSAYVGEGTNSWSGVARQDAARLYRLVLEQGASERVYHAVAEESVPFRQIAEAIGARLGLPVEARPAAHFGALAHFVGMDLQASAERTRALLGWAPAGIGLLADIAKPDYFG